jgi:hypothetical protein
MASYMLIRHKVRDFSEWKRGYDAHLPKRIEAGLTEKHLLSLNFSPIEKIKAALRGIKVVSSISYAKGEERPYGNRVYNRTNGISATGAAPSDGEI